MQICKLFVFTGLQASILDLRDLMKDPFKKIMIIEKFNYNNKSRYRLYSKRNNRAEKKE